MLFKELALELALSFGYISGSKPAILWKNKCKFQIKISEKLQY